MKPKKRASRVAKYHPQEDALAMFLEASVALRRSESLGDGGASAKWQGRVRRNKIPCEGFGFMSIYFMSESGFSLQCHALMTRHEENTVTRDLAFS